MKMPDWIFISERVRNFYIAVDSQEEEEKYSIESEIFPII